MYKVVFSKKAENDLLAASSWYAGRQMGLDARFERNVFAAIEKLQSDEFIHSIVYRELSRVFVNKFPYRIYFKKNPAKRKITIYRILHDKQDILILDESV